MRAQAHPPQQGDHERDRRLLRGQLAAPRGRRAGLCGDDARGRHRVGGREGAGPRLRELPGRGGRDREQQEEDRAVDQPWPQVGRRDGQLGVLALEPPHHPRALRRAVGHRRLRAPHAALDQRRRDDQPGPDPRVQRERGHPDRERNGRCGGDRGGGSAGSCGRGGVHAAGEPARDVLGASQGRGGAAREQGGARGVRVGAGGERQLRRHSPR
mmetsp:Transcript_43762/g.103466  ORF Transcript_43762/g.103466 Transcript_43762/m.103466 type:complete len:213 (-) Transcript_43762:509-1147(-)